MQLRPKDRPWMILVDLGWRIDIRSSAFNHWIEVLLSVYRYKLCRIKTKIYLVIEYLLVIAFCLHLAEDLFWDQNHLSGHIGMIECNTTFIFVRTRLTSAKVLKMVLEPIKSFDKSSIDCSIVFRCLYICLLSSFNHLDLFVCGKVFRWGCHWTTNSHTYC